MPSVLQHLAARLGLWHAQRVYARFVRDLHDVEHAQHIALQRVLELCAPSAFGRRYQLARVRTPADLRRAAPLATYEDFRPWIDRLCAGDTAALFAPGTPLLMFATSSGTTSQPKRIPVTPAFVADYRCGWNIFGLRLLSDHPQAILRAILQCTGRHDESYTPAGTPCGAITGLLAKTQKSIVRQFYVGRYEIAQLPDPQARYYTLLRYALTRDVAFAITANPATLIRLAQVLADCSEPLLRDVRDGTLSREFVPYEPLRTLLARGLRPNPLRSHELEAILRRDGVLHPSQTWKIQFLACWTGGTMGNYLQRLAECWGPMPIRDVGLLASEGRVTIPLADNTPIGVLDVTGSVFEFIPAAQADHPDPDVLGPRDLEPDHDYIVVLTNTTGLIRYRLNDVVRAHGFMGQAPLLEFRHRAGGVASVAGEKLTESQVVAAVAELRRAAHTPEFDFVMAPCWADPPHYRVTCTFPLPANLVAQLDSLLAAQNDEYASRRKSNRLGPLKVRLVTGDALHAMDRQLVQKRRGSAEQYKRPCLFSQPGEDDALLNLTLGAG
jgi:hypothetical protein